MPTPDHHPVWLFPVIVQRTEARQQHEWRFAVRAATFQTAYQKALKLAMQRYRRRFGNWQAAPHALVLGQPQQFDAVP